MSSSKVLASSRVAAYAARAASRRAGSCFSTSAQAARRQARQLRSGRDSFASTSTVWPHANVVATTWPTQIRQAAPSPRFHAGIPVRAATVSDHSCPAGQLQWARSEFFAEVFCGVWTPLRSGCQVAAISG
ncbi:hypothetical protein QRX50_36535 [Amycolatopsis carbonis]|uniref:Uncharacterized protein n=1 Tax=Amycolatopsis carbonis TaxID=715471 RepID=A0A9Y2IE77_9PSEU|nr:hypothetical protein [Amycolatopsis sp. 2-15]WIX76893.1 hypothetical protein QRX50_36535 [Amycolatopsis sp. 2-15]